MLGENVQNFRDFFSASHAQNHKWLHYCQMQWVIENLKNSILWIGLIHVRVNSDEQWGENVQSKKHTLHLEIKPDTVLCSTIAYISRPRPCAGIGMTAACCCSQDTCSLSLVGQLRSRSTVLLLHALLPVYRTPWHKAAVEFIRRQWRHL